VRGDKEGDEEEENKFEVTHERAIEDYVRVV